MDVRTDDSNFADRGGGTYPPFQPRWPWIGGDLQTLRNIFFPTRPDAADETLYLHMGDTSGDRLLAQLFRGEDRKPLIVLMHGLAGCAESTYMVLARRALSLAGFPVLLLNLRGAAPSRATCRLQYHAGRSEDLRDAILALPEALMQNGVVMVGFSLAGNMTLKFAAEYASDAAQKLPVLGVTAVSAPADLALTSDNMLRPRNYVYNQSLLADYKKQCTNAGAYVSEEERSAIFKSRNFVDFDNYFVAPRNGFLDAEDYWAKCMAKQFLPAIKIPTLIIHAQNDPMVPFAVYDDVNWRDNRDLTPLFPKDGGHVGFHGAEGVWYVEAIARFVADL